jgi:hypothetical protein
MKGEKAMYPKVSLKAGSILAALLIFAVASPAQRAANNAAGSESVGWNLTGDVMSVPPYGTIDIPGSDSASRILVNRPNGKTNVTLTGLMGGLMPNTKYTVYLSNPHDIKGWSVLGDWELEYKKGSVPRIFQMAVTKQAGSGAFEGTGRWQDDPVTSWTVQGSVTDAIVDLKIRPPKPGYSIGALGGIDTMTGKMSGSWQDNLGQTGSWSSKSGSAAYLSDADKIWWEGFFNETRIPTFTFLTNPQGSGNWHLNMVTADFPGPGTCQLSVFINDDSPDQQKTVLVSDNFEIVVK